MAKNALATEVRAHAVDKGYEVGQRGRLSVDLFTIYLNAQTPARIREIAADAGIQVNAKGRISDETVTSLASALR